MAKAQKEPAPYTIKLRTPQGFETEIPCLEIVSINGKPFHPSEEIEEIKQMVLIHEGRLSTIESAIFSGERV